MKIDKGVRAKDGDSHINGVTSIDTSTVVIKRKVDCYKIRIVICDLPKHIGIN